MVTFAFGTLLSHIPPGNTEHIIYNMNRKVQVACNFNYLLENEGLLKVTASHVHCKSGNMSETVQIELLLLQTTNNVYMAYE